MNASTSTSTFDHTMPAVPARRPGAFRALLRKDLTEWLRGRRAWVVLAMVSIFMVLAAANSWIIASIADVVPAEEAPAAPASLAPLDNLFAGVGAQIFLFAAIFAVASLLVRERESGTLAWVASKPVSRRSIWLSKWVSASAMLVVVAVVAPMAITTLSVVAMYGVPDIAPVLILTAGAAAAVVFYTALGLAASAILPGQVPVVATGFLVFAVVPMVGGLISAVTPVLPTSIFDWSIGVVTGADVGWVTPLAWLGWTAALVGVGTNRIGRLEL